MNGLQVCGGFVISGVLDVNVVAFGTVKLLACTDVFKPRFIDTFGVVAAPVLLAAVRGFTSESLVNTLVPSASDAAGLVVFIVDKIDDCI